jgi:hypothetical protein
LYAVPADEEFDRCYEYAGDDGIGYCLESLEGVFLTFAWLGSALNPQNGLSHLPDPFVPPTLIKSILFRKNKAHNPNTGEQ